METFIANFKLEYSRSPTTTEIYENLQDELTTVVIDSVLNKQPQENKKINDNL